VPVAFAAAMFGSALLSALTEPAVALLGWGEAAQAERPELLLAALSYTVRPLIGAAVGCALLAAGVAAGVAERAAPAAAAAGAGGPAPALFERLAVGGIAVLAAVGAWRWLALRSALRHVADAPGELSIAVGAAASLGLIACAVAIGIVRASREYRSGG
jgi:hypothetical protein